MKVLLIITLMILSLEAVGINSTELNENNINLPNEDYNTVIGKGSNIKATGIDNVEDYDLPRTEQKSSGNVKKFSDETYIYYQMIKLQEKRGETKESSQNNAKNNSLLILPTLAANEIKNIGNATNTTNEKSSEKVASLLLLRCYTDIDWKINNKSSLKFFCNEINKKDNTIYKLRANLQILKGNQYEMKSIPYMLEDDKGTIYSIDTQKSKIFNAISGDENIATYVDKRAIDGGIKAMANTMTKEVPTLAKDYLDKKNESDSTISQNEYSTIVSTSATKPEVSDYGFTLLLSTLSSGASAFVDQLYMDLGYIYFIPKGSIVEAELFVYKE